MSCFLWSSKVICWNVMIPLLPEISLHGLVRPGLKSLVRSLARDFLRDSRDHFLQEFLALREQRNHCLKYESDCVSIGFGIKRWIMRGFVRDCFVEFLSSTPQSNQNILSVPEQVFIPAVSHMKIANIHVWTIHQNVRIALQFSYLSYQFAIFISVCNSHVSVYSSYVEVCNFHMSLQFSYEFAIFISVCNSHVTTPALNLYGFAWILCHYDLELIKSMWFSVEDKDKLELSKIDYYLLYSNLPK